MGPAIGIVVIGLVDRHVEAALNMACVDADRRQPLGTERMIEPHRRIGLEHQPATSADITSVRLTVLNLTSSQFRFGRMPGDVTTRF